MAKTIAYIEASQTRIFISNLINQKRKCNDINFVYKIGSLATSCRGERNIFFHAIRLDLLELFIFLIKAIMQNKWRFDLKLGTNFNERT